jgi:hypothetical protein
MLIKSVVENAPRLDHEESAQRMEKVRGMLLLSCSCLDKVEDAATVLLLNLCFERLKSVHRRGWTFTLLGIVGLGLRWSVPLLIGR